MSPEQAAALAASRAAVVFLTGGFAAGVLAWNRGVAIVQRAVDEGRDLTAAEQNSLTDAFEAGTQNLAGVDPNV